MHTFRGEGFGCCFTDNTDFALMWRRHGHLAVMQEISGSIEKRRRDATGRGARCHRFRVIVFSIVNFAIIAANRNASLIIPFFPFLSNRMVQMQSQVIRK
jgi:hypothetical protein